MKLLSTGSSCRRLILGSDNSSDDEDKDEEFEPEDASLITAYRIFRSLAEEGPSTALDLSTLTGLGHAVEAYLKVPREKFDLLFPALVPTFGLKEKKWRWVLSDQLEDVQWHRSAFQSLQLEQVTKDLIEALVKGHKSKSMQFDDVVPGKGQGLIFLLHGQPGLGKTLTAESVADYLERPLYSISGGELSTNVSRLEARLNEIFDLTKRWNAVSLLDEADVLLCKRTSAEMDRNTIVAVFLRKIEYFQGVLFLTTNRKDEFDNAFKSRIHVTISYRPLSETAQGAIRKKLIEANRSVKVDDSWTDDVYSALRKLGLNGRTIKNILRTACAYAHADDMPLRAHHVLGIAQTELQGDDGDDEEGGEN